MNETSLLLAKSNRILERVKSLDANLDLKHSMDMFNLKLNTPCEKSKYDIEHAVTPNSNKKANAEGKCNFDTDLLDSVSRFECKHCQWLVNKDNFEVHILFCKEKVDTMENDTSDDGMVMISSDADTQVRYSSPNLAFNDI